MKTNRRLWSVLLVAVVVGVTLLTVLSTVVAAAGNGPVGQGLSLVVGGTLGEAEEEGLLYMREEEKLARDVYQFLYDQWGLPVFQNIASSEQQHMDAVKGLLDRYGVADPASATMGEFTNADLQAMYDELVATGAQSLEQALRVGATIEEVDILDLEKHIAETDQADIIRVYEALARGSRNHLRAFASTLSWQTGVTYEPQYLAQETYDELINALTERGGGRWSGNGGVRTAR